MILKFHVNTSSFTLQNTRIFLHNLIFSGSHTWTTQNYVDDAHLRSRGLGPSFTPSGHAEPDTQKRNELQVIEIEERKRTSIVVTIAENGTALNASNCLASIEDDANDGGSGRRPGGDNNEKVEAAGCWRRSWNTTI